MHLMVVGYALVVTALVYFNLSFYFYEDHLYHVLNDEVPPANGLLTYTHFFGLILQNYIRKNIVSVG